MDVSNIRSNSIGTYNNKNIDEDIKNMQNQQKKSTLDMDDFLQLLAAQLRYQDMSSPMDNAQMMQQMTQMTTVSAMTTMSDMMSAMGQVSTTTYASSMIGKELTVVEKLDDKGKPITKKGLVTGVGFFEGIACIYIDGKAYGLNQILSMGDVPEEGSDEEPDKPAHLPEVPPAHLPVL